jgi:hypothetical protein
MVTTGTAITDERYTPCGTARDVSQQAAVPYRYLAAARRFYPKLDLLPKINVGEYRKFSTK